MDQLIRPLVLLGVLVASAACTPFQLSLGTLDIGIQQDAVTSEDNPFGGSSEDASTTDSGMEPSGDKTQENVDETKDGGLTPVTKV
jgi:hypothetical protein